MSLLDDYSEEITIIDSITVPDGYGGAKLGWQEGVTVFAQIIPEESALATIAQAITEVQTYQVITDKNVSLFKGMVFKRKKDGATFRVLKDNTDQGTPKSAGLQKRKTTAERWNIPL